MSGRVLSCCAALVVMLACVSAVQKLNSISDLKTIDFGQSVPKHSLILLHWFANAVEIDNNNVLRLTFDPNSDYGSHHYGNFERILDPLPRGHRYYTIGNLNHGTSESLPDYVTHPPSGYSGRNRDRIIIRVREQTIDRTFITQHYEISEERGILYDPNHTYEITINLLRQIREFSLSNNHLPLLHLRNRYQTNADIDNIKVEWSNLACLGLFLFIVIKEKYTRREGSNRPTFANTPYNNRPTFANTPYNNRPTFANIPYNNRPTFANTPDISSNSNSWQQSNYSDDNRNTPTNCRCSWKCILVFIIIIVIVVSVGTLVPLLLREK